jgi:hypothetical protein
VTRFLLLHGPHLVLALGAFAVVLVSALRAQPQQEDAFALPATAAPAPAAPAAAAPARRGSRRIARLGLLALAPLALAVVSGVALYALDLSGHRPGAFLRLGHAGVSTLALLMVSYKVLAIGARRLRAALQGERAGRTLSSLVLAGLGVPLALTGVALLLDPGSGSLYAYLHLIASAWWTVLLGTHLLRHLPRALRVT